MTKKMKPDRTPVGWAGPGRLITRPQSPLQKAIKRKIQKGKK